MAYGLTVKTEMLLVTLPEEAVMFVVAVEDTLAPVAIPVLAIVAELVFEELHVTELVRSTVLPSFSLPSAVKF